MAGKQSPESRSDRSDKRRKRCTTQPRSNKGEDCEETAVEIQDERKTVLPKPNKKAAVPDPAYPRQSLIVRRYVKDNRAISGWQYGMVVPKKDAKMRFPVLSMSNGPLNRAIKLMDDVGNNASAMIEECEKEGRTKKSYQPAPPTPIDSPKPTPEMPEARKCLSVRHTKASFSTCLAQPCCVLETRPLPTCELRKCWQKSCGK